MHQLRTYVGMVSSDWNQCLAPCGPFDAIAFRYPELESELADIFQQYTANRMTLTTATQHIRARIPAPLSATDMDAYLASRFEMYPGVTDLIAWCDRNQILFMINTTGPLGYFQRALAAGLLPEVPVLSAHPFIGFPSPGEGQPLLYELNEITDKALNSAKAAGYFGIPLPNIIVMGDSGGDGPHFEWAAGVGATTIGSMLKPSLAEYCRARAIEIQHCFGHAYAKGERVAPEKERRYNFLDLSKVIGRVLAL